jgi:hypothetical protein
MQGSDSRPESTCGVCGGSPQNWPSYMVEPQNQDRRLGGRRRDPGVLRSFDAGGHVAGSQGLRREDADCGEGVAVRRTEVLHDLFAPEVFVSQLCNRGSFIFRMPPYMPRRERIAGISQNPSSFSLAICRSYFL